MRQRIAAVFAALLLAFGGVVAAPAPASAGWNDCDPGQFCTWANTNYWGTFVMTQGPTETCINLNPADGTSALYNYRPYDTIIFELRDCGGSGHVVDAYESVAAVPSPWHDRVRAIWHMTGGTKRK